MTTQITPPPPTTPTGNAGGDLSGTYPNPSVVDDSHAHTGATLPSYQPLDSDLTAIAALSTTAFGRGLLALADPADATKFLDGTGVFSTPAQAAFVSPATATPEAIANSLIAAGLMAAS